MDGQQRALVFKEQRQQARVKAAPGLGTHVAEYLFDRQYRLIVAIDHQLIKNIGNRGNSPGLRYGFPGKPARVTRTIEILMMGVGDDHRQPHPGKLGTGQQSGSDLGMTPVRASITA